MKLSMKLFGSNLYTFSRQGYITRYQRLSYKKSCRAMYPIYSLYLYFCGSDSSQKYKMFIQYRYTHVVTIHIYISSLLSCSVEF